MSERHANLSFSLTLEYTHHVHSLTRVINTQNARVCIRSLCGNVRYTYTRACIRGTRIQLEVYVWYMYVHICTRIRFGRVDHVRVERAARPRQLYVHLKKKKKKNRSSYDRNSDLSHACRIFKSQQRVAQHAPRTIRVYIANQRATSIARPFLETRAKVFFDLRLLVKSCRFFFRLRVDHWSTLSFETILFKSILL